MSKKKSVIEASPEEDAIRQFLGTSGRRACGATDLARQIVKEFTDLEVKPVAAKIREWFRADVIVKTGKFAPYLYKLA